MSSGHYCVIRDLGLVKGGKGMKHHEVVLALTARGLGVFGVGFVRRLAARCSASDVAPPVHDRRVSFNAANFETVTLLRTMLSWSRNRNGA
jgi:hypothetical protein